MVFITRADNKTFCLDFWPPRSATEDKHLRFQYFNNLIEDNIFNDISVLNLEFGSTSTPTHFTLWRSKGQAEPFSVWVPRTRNTLVSAVYSMMMRYMMRLCSRDVILRKRTAKMWGSRQRLCIYIRQPSKKEWTSMFWTRSFHRKPHPLFSITRWRLRTGLQWKKYCWWKTRLFYSFLHFIFITKSSTLMNLLLCVLISSNMYYYLFKQLLFMHIKLWLFLFLFR